MAAASHLLGALRRISVSQASVIFISTDGLCQWLVSLYASINKTWEKIALARASQAEIMVLEFFLCTHKVTAFCSLQHLFHVYVSQPKPGLAIAWVLQYGFNFVLCKVVSGVKSSLFSASSPTCKICPPSHTCTAEIPHKFLYPALPGMSPHVRGTQLMCSCIFKAGVLTFPVCAVSAQRDLFQVSGAWCISGDLDLLPCPASASLSDPGGILHSICASLPSP